MTLFEVVTNNKEFNNRNEGLCFVSFSNGCNILYFDKMHNDIRVWETSTIKKTVVTESKIEIETKNSTYIFLKHINTVEEELIELYVLNANLRLREAKEKAKEITKPVDILREIHKLNNL